MNQGRSCRVLGPVMLDVSAEQLSVADRGRLAHEMVGGVILFGRNYRDPDQLADLVQDIRAVNPELVIAVDQEGGRVQRFRQGFYRLPPLAVLGRWYDDDAQAACRGAEVLGFLMAIELITKGIDISFAPVLDLDLGLSEVIGDRAFHSEPSVVIQLAQAYIKGMISAGMKATAKHFPGHGSVAEDSHLELPVDRRSLEQIQQRDMLPFISLASESISAIMTAHVIVPAVDDKLITFSSRWIQQIIRHQYGFEGVIFSDDLCMNAAQCFGRASACAEAAWRAGCNVLLVCNDEKAADEILLWAETNLNQDDLKQSTLATMRSDPINLSQLQSLYTEIDQVLAVTKQYQSSP